MRVLPIAAAFLGLLGAEYAGAVCSYHGVMYAKTSLAQEFRDSPIVARVRVLSATDAQSDDPSPAFLRRWGPYNPVTLYRLRLVHAYKGKPPTIVRFFTERSSGGFYFDRPWAGHDVGGEYLVFLIPNRPYRGQGSEARGTFFANYACGQSKPWSEVGRNDRILLNRLSQHR